MTDEHDDAGLTAEVSALMRQLTPVLQAANTSPNVTAVACATLAATIIQTNYALGMQWITMQNLVQMMWKLLGEPPEESEELGEAQFMVKLNELHNFCADCNASDTVRLLLDVLASVMAANTDTAPGREQMVEDAAEQLRFLLTSYS